MLYILLLPLIMKKMKYITLTLLIFLLISCKNDKSADSNLTSDNFYMPAEWESQDAVWLG
jgi:agmatine deiminase